MKLISTRDESQKEYSYTDVLLAGLAPDGGLFTPLSYPHVSLEEIASFRGAPYRDIAFTIKKKIIGGDIPDDVLHSLVDAAYSDTSFLPTKDGNVAPLQTIGNGVFIEQLSLGPTAAFKDVAMQMLGQEMNYELSKRNEHLIILGATSGDTGSAAEAAFKGLEHVTIFMLSPERGMSPFQKAQMGALSGGNVLNISVRGVFDDCQDLVKKLKNEKEFEKLGAVNSINWGRISSQVPYYFSGYVQAVQAIGDEVDFCIPSGNFGNALSGYIAKQMGLPIRRLIIATNENNVLDTLFNTGIYAQTPTRTTSSPSMDISKASNYERFAFDLLGRDAAKLREYMHIFETTGSVDLKEFGVSVSDLCGQGFESGVSTHTDRLGSIRSVYEKANIVIDTHTADAVTVGIRAKKDSVPLICMSTALPVKFEDSIKEALGFVTERSERFMGLENSLPEDAFIRIDADAEQLRAFIRSHS
ncbi:MAG: threonine synthase [Patescibacteria group bacterium]